MKVLVVEDNKDQAEYVIEKIEVSLGKEDIEIIGPFDDFPEAYEQIQSRKIDIAVLDIQLFDDPYAGVRLGQVIEHKGHTPIIFVTGLTDERIIKKTENIDNSNFLQKPFDQESFNGAMKEARLKVKKRLDLPMLKIAHKAGGRDVFWLQRNKSNFTEIEVNDIKWVRVEERCCYFAENGQPGEVEVTMKFDDLCELVLEEYENIFYRIHRGIIVNINYVKSIKGKKIYIKDSVSNELQEFSFPEKRQPGLFKKLKI